MDARVQLAYDQLVSRFAAWVEGRYLEELAADEDGFVFGTNVLSLTGELRDVRVFFGGDVPPEMPEATTVNFGTSCADWIDGYGMKGDGLADVFSRERGFESPERGNPIMLTYILRHLRKGTPQLRDIVVKELERVLTNVTTGANLGFFHGEGAPSDSN